MSLTLLILSSFLYLGVLFVVAYFFQKKGIVSKGWIYILSLGVYCTAWTYYGSIEKAYSEGLNFLAIYLGPTIAAPLFGVVLRKMIHICKVQSIHSIPDFLAKRYVSNSAIALLVSFVLIIGILPYLSIQLKAISESFQLMNQQELLSQKPNFWQDKAFFTALIFGAFVAFFSGKNIDQRDHHPGLMGVVAFESIFKLISILALGIFVVFFLFQGWGDLAHQFHHLALPNGFFQIPEKSQGLNWWLLLLVSGISVFLLPRQFHVMVVENHEEKDVFNSIWAFPLYLLLINLFILPILMAGLLVFSADQNLRPEWFALQLPLSSDYPFMALWVYLGGLSAAGGMLIVSLIALSTILSNHLLIPQSLYFRQKLKTKTDTLNKWIFWSKKGGIMLVVLLAYCYHYFIGFQYSLVTTGLFSFVAVAQLAPAFFGGMYWKYGTGKGAFWGILMGALTWVYTLILPTLSTQYLWAENLVETGLFGMAWLKPQALFLYDELQPVPHSIFWSLLLNTATYLVVSIWSSPNTKEWNQAAIFVDIFKYENRYEKAIAWKGSADTESIKALLVNFFGPTKTEHYLRTFAQKYDIDYDRPYQADAKLVIYTEKLLAGAIGVSAAKTVLASIVKEEELQMQEVLYLLKETQELIQLNKALQEKSEALKKTTAALQEANEKLKAMDEQKDEFIGTVTHEMKTPLTSIKAFAEILEDHEDLTTSEKNNFLSTIIAETDRMTRLIEQVLDLERFDSGQQSLNKERINIIDIYKDASQRMRQMLKDKGIVPLFNAPDKLPDVLADKDRMLQVFINLLTNALIHAKSKIHITIYYIDGDIKVNISNDGKPLEADTQELLFDKFYQAKNQNLKKPKGSGLGLAICKKIIEHHDGKIWASNDEQLKGARFSFLLPVTWFKNNETPETYLKNEN